jgi:lipoprotein-anchoring transpeptidase ErfK/SrfK
MGVIRRRELRDRARPRATAPWHATVRRALVVCSLAAISESAWAQTRPRSTSAPARAAESSWPTDSSRIEARRRAGQLRTRAVRRESAGDLSAFDRPLFEASSPSRFRSRADSLTSVRARTAADAARELRIVISLNDRRLWVLIGPDTLLVAPVAVSTDATLEYAGRTWTFETPRGVRTVRAKTENPVWTPPDWHYAEVASEYGLKLASMMPGKPVKLNDGSRLEVRNNEVGVVRADADEFEPLRTDEEIVFDETLFIPPIGTVNRRIEGELGYHMLDTGNGFLVHGTPHKKSIGTAATHGCIRLRDQDIAWLYEMIPVGARVYIY